MITNNRKSRTWALDQKRLKVEKIINDIAISFDGTLLNADDQRWSIPFNGGDQVCAVIQINHVFGNYRTKDWNIQLKTWVFENRDPVFEKERKANIFDSYYWARRYYSDQRKVRSILEDATNPQHLTQFILEHAEEAKRIRLSNAQRKAKRFIENRLTNDDMLELLARDRCQHVDETVRMEARDLMIELETAINDLKTNK